MSFLTNLADEAVILPLAAAIAIALLALGWRKGAVAWIVGVAGTLALMLVLKLLGVACGPPLLRTPSGHTAAAAVVCGGLAVILLRGDRRLAIVVALLASAVIGLSRLSLGMHSLPEVMLGGAVGVAGALLLAQLAGPPPHRFRARWVMGLAVAAPVLFHGDRLPAEDHIRGIAYNVARELQMCRGVPGWGWPEDAQDRPYVSSSRTISSSPR